MSPLLPYLPIGHVTASRKTGDAAFRLLPADEFTIAQREITAWQGYAETPLVSLKALAAEIGVADVFYKDEGPRFGLGSFKALGGAYAALRVLQREISGRLGFEVSLADIRQGKYAEQCATLTLVSATDGNHGRSLAWGCKRFGVPCRIYIHASVSANREAAMTALGADVIRIDGDYDDSVVRCKKDALDNEWFIVSDTSWPGYSSPPSDVMSGYSVMVKEVCDRLTTPPTHVFLQAGVGGMAAGVIAAMRQHWGNASPRAIVVEPELAACLFESARTGYATRVTVEKETLMAGLSCGEPSEIAWNILAEEVTDYLTIPEALVGPAVRLLAHPVGDDPVIQAGESAVAGLAALVAARSDPALASRLALDTTSRVLLFGTEGVTDPEVFQMIMEEKELA